MHGFQHIKLDAQEIKFTGAINREKEKFDGLKAQAADLDRNELTDARLALRQQMGAEAQAGAINIDAALKSSWGPASFPVHFHTAAPRGE